jgi:hypothetical protein
MTLLFKENNAAKFKAVKDNFAEFPKELILNSHSGGLSPNWVHSARRPLLAYCTCPE